MSSNKDPRRELKSGAEPSLGEPGSTVFSAREAQGDPEHPSWNDLLSKIERMIRREFPERSVPAPYGIGDLVALAQQRVFRDLFRMEVRDRQSFWGWVRQLTRNALVDLARRAKPRGGVEVRPIHSGRESTADLDPQDDQLTTASVLTRVHETQDAMLECLQGMKGDHAEVLRMRLLEHLSYAEIAERMDGVQEPTLRSIFNRGRIRLAKCMLKKGFGSFSD